MKYISQLSKKTSSEDETRCPIFETTTPSPMQFFFFFNPTGEERENGRMLHMSTQQLHFFSASKKTPESSIERLKSTVRKPP
jgi:hypothetical protein